MNMADLVSSLIRNIWGSDKPKEVKEEVNKEPKKSEKSVQEDFSKRVNEYKNKKGDENE